MDDPSAGIPYLTETDHLQTSSIPGAVFGDTENTSSCGSKQAPENILSSTADARDELATYESVYDKPSPKPARLKRKKCLIPTSESSDEDGVRDGPGFSCADPGSISNTKKSLPTKSYHHKRKSDQLTFDIFSPHYDPFASFYTSRPEADPQGPRIFEPSSLTDLQRTRNMASLDRRSSFDSRASTGYQEIVFDSTSVNPACRSSAPPTPSGRRGPLTELARAGMKAVKELVHAGGASSFERNVTQKILVFYVQRVKDQGRKPWDVNVETSSPGLF